MYNICSCWKYPNQNGQYIDDHEYPGVAKLDYSDIRRR